MSPISIFLPTEISQFLWMEPLLYEFDKRDGSQGHTGFSSTGLVCLALGIMVKR
jgi:hypothetical protein